MKKIAILLFGLFSLIGHSQTVEIKYIPAQINFGVKINDWDGFGFNYVETAQTRDYFNQPQDYGGFSLLDEKSKNEIVNLVFADTGLNIDILKIFLDPFHQSLPGDKFDHVRSTKNMMDFITRGLKVARKNNKEIDVITTLYGPPAWATLQKFVGGRDLDYKQDINLCNYIIDWIIYLRNKNINVKYVSLHNEGEDFYRWDYKEGSQRFHHFDYNMYWSPEQVNYFLKLLPAQLKKIGLPDIGVTNGEPSNWHRFYNWGYAHALYNDDKALDNLGLITTHGFLNGNFRKISHATINSSTTDLLRKKKPDLHCWITSYSWGEMNTDFIKSSHEHIYAAKVNALIPWAGIQNPSSWYDGDPNPGSAIRVNENGTFEVLPGYYFYKQLTQAGKKGMSVVEAYLANAVSYIMAFGSNGTNHPDAFVLTSNFGVKTWQLPVRIMVSGTKSTKFKAFRTSEDGKELYKEIGVYDLTDGSLIYEPPYGTTTTFIAID